MDAADETQGHLVPPACAPAISVSRELLDDCAGMNDLIGKALRGEIEFKPPPEPKRHRCIACWLVSLLPGHERCEHGYLNCDDCRWQD